MKHLIADDHTGRPQHYYAETYDELLEQMRRDAFIDSESNEDYMAGVAQRAKLWDRSVIRTDSAEHFLVDMTACGQVTLDTAD